MLTNSPEKIFQSGIIGRGMSDHQLIFCTRKVKRAKFNKHNNIFLRPLKHYTVHVFVEELERVNFSSYEHFSYLDAAYSYFTNKLMKESVKLRQERTLELLKIIRKNGFIEELLN